MKIFKFMTLALVAMLGFSSCSEDCNHEFIEVDYSKDLVGTWTCLTADYAEALVIKADGSVVSTGVENGEYWDGVKGSIKTTNNKMTLLFEDNDNYEGRFEMICGEAFTIFDENGKHLTYRYCANDLADEIVGMWVCNDSKVDAQNDMMIETFDANGKTSLTGFLPMGDNPEYVVKDETDYKVVGDLMFLAVPADKVGGDKPKYISERLIYTPKATALGDVMTFTNYSSDENKLVSELWLRIKETLDLAGKEYDYIKTFVTNVKGKDEDIQFFNNTLNFAKMDNSVLDKFLKKTIFSVEFPDANKIKYSFLEAQLTSLSAPIEVEGNKMTIKMSANNSAYRDIEIHAFQDVDGCQFHMYMHTEAFENFLGNMQVTLMLESGQLNQNDSAAVKAVFDKIANAVETINLSLVMSK